MTEKSRRLWEYFVDKRAFYKNRLQKAMDRLRRELREVSKK